MCYDDKAVPPDLPQQGGAARGEDIVLQASDGNRFAAYIARPASAGNAQVIIYPDVRGLHNFYKLLAMRFAEAGITAIAIDYFGRSAGLTSRDDSFEYMPHVQQMTLGTFFEDVKAAQSYLRANVGAQNATFTMGFCMGGSLSFYTGTQPDFGLAGVIGFYSGFSRVFPGAKGPLLEEGAHMKYPALGLFGGADQGISEEQVRTFDEALDRAGVEHEVVIYPGAPHSFFDRRATDFAEASADAWRRVLGFIAAHSS
jgi:carboxymethylenebutenolidase